MIECTELVPLVTVLSCILVPLHIFSALCFCLIEIEAMVVAVQQALEEFNDILTVCIVLVSHRPPTCAVTIHITCTDQHWNRYHNSARIQDQPSIRWQHPKKTLISAS